MHNSEESTKNRFYDSLPVSAALGAYYARVRPRDSKTPTSPTGLLPYTENDAAPQLRRVCCAISSHVRPSTDSERADSVGQKGRLLTAFRVWSSYKLGQKAGRLNAVARGAV